MRGKIHNIGRGGRIVLALVVAGMAFGVATAVQAAIPSANGVISGCYAKAGSPSQGALRVVDQGNPCKPGENPLDWNQTGQTGPQGPTGPTGATGPKGPTGPGGISGYEVVSLDTVITESTNNARHVETATVNCPAGKSAIGGGGSGTWLDPVFSHAADVARSEPTLLPTDKWTVGIAKLNGDFFLAGEKANIHLVVICANLP